MIHTDGQPTIANARALPDFVVRNHGSVFLFQPCTARAKQWIEDQVVDPQYFGQSLAVDARYAFDLADGIFDEGFRIE